MLAQREGLRIHEVPVDWVDDPDSRVDIVAHGARPTCAAIVRLLAAARLTRFLTVGVCSTLAYALLFLLLREPLGAQAANAARARDHRGRQHGRQPPLHLRRARPPATVCASTPGAPSSSR